MPPALAPAMAVAPSAPVGPSGLDASFVVPQVTFESGFCAPEGDETIELHYSLQRLLIDELHRRLQPDGGDAGGAPSLSLLRQVIDPSTSREDVVRAAEQASHETPDSPFPYLIGLASVVGCCWISAVRRPGNSWVPRCATRHWRADQ